MAKFFKKKTKITEKDLNNSKLELRLIELINRYQNEKKLNNDQIKILDWGCGIGTEVLKLRENDYDAFGVEINENLIKKNLPFFNDRGYDDSILQVVSEENKTNFPEDFFDIIISNQVFEHVENIESLFSEMNRILKISGIGYHRFPASKKIKEVLLKMPFVHWLPKNKLRKFLITFFVFIGVEPRWSEVKGKSFWSKVNTYYQYSIQSTFYRKNSKLKEIGNRSGLDITFNTHINPIFKKNQLVNKLLSTFFAKKLTIVLFNTFRRVELSVVKKH